MPASDTWLRIAVGLKLPNPTTERIEELMVSHQVAFPDDENGDVLRQMTEQGDNLEIPREIDFSVIFPTEDAALKFAVLLLRNGQKVSFSEYEEHDELPWQVQAHPFMVPTHENISGYEALLAEEAEAFAGQNDGWGCEIQE